MKQDPVRVWEPGVLSDTFKELEMGTSPTWWRQTPLPEWEGDSLQKERGPPPQRASTQYLTKNS